MTALLTDGDVDFLALILPQLEAIKDADTVLGEPERIEEHGPAARRSLEALCVSLGAFQRRVVPRLNDLKTPSDVRQLRESAWLDTAAQKINAELTKLGDPRLLWPPPGQKPPALVADLALLYESAVESTEWFWPVEPALLTRIFRPIERKACSIAQAWPSSGVAPKNARPFSQPRTNGKYAGISYNRQIATSLSGAALGITILQGPSALLDVGPATADLVQAAWSATSVGMHAAWEVIASLRQELGIDIVFKPGGGGMTL